MIVWLIAIGCFLYGLYLIFGRHQVLWGVILVVVGLFLGALGPIGAFDDDIDEDGLGPPQLVLMNEAA